MVCELKLVVLSVFTRSFSENEPRLGEQVSQDRCNAIQGEFFGQFVYLSMSWQQSS